MPGLTVRPFEAADIEPAAALLAARQVRERSRLPMLAAALTEPEACAAIVRGLHGRPRAGGVVATRRGEFAGFLFGEQMLFGPADHAAKYIEPHSIAMPNEGHAIAAGEDPVALYRAMYAELARGWARDGFYVHTAHITAGDAALRDAWFNLGFGCNQVCATREVSAPVNGAAPNASIEIHEAGPEDIDVVMQLDWELYEHHSRSPIFWPLLKEPRPAARAHTARMLEDPANAHFVAYDGGRPIAMQTFEAPGFTPVTLDHAGSIYLHDGIVSETARGGGVGTALLEHAMAWARKQGHRWCTLHFASGNPSGAPFWLGHGFIPVEYTMSRHLDERVAYANDW
jgi:GNAT superfamily N-acetyltransferase